MDSAIFGLQAEEQAAQYLETTRGWRTLAKRVRFREGELDIVMETREGSLVFVEVKARRSFEFGAAVESVTAEKVRRLKRAVGKWREQSKDRRPGELLLVAMEWRDGALSVEEVPLE